MRKVQFRFAVPAAAVVALAAMGFAAGEASAKAYNISKDRVARVCSSVASDFKSSSGECIKCSPPGNCRYYGCKKDGTDCKEIIL